MRHTALFCLLLASGLSAQQQPTVHSGPDALFVIAGEHIPRAEGPVTGYRIERRSGGDEPFKEVAELKPVTNAKDLRKGLERAAKVLPYAIDADSYPLNRIMAAIMEKGTRPTLGIWSMDMPVLLASQVAWADADAQRGTLYQYRVITLGRDTTIVTNFISHGSSPKMARMQPMGSRFHERDRQLDLRWMPLEGERPTAIRLWRSRNDGPFEAVPFTARLQPIGDSLLYVLTDTTAERYQLYRYVLQAFDLAGNAAPAADTLSTAALDPMQMPMPTRLSAAGDSSGRSIRIEWELPNEALVKQMILMRSTNSLDGFDAVAVLAPGTGRFIDEAVAPSKPYFYYLLLEYKTQHQPVRSHTFASVVHDPHPPLPPGFLRAEALPEGNRIEWSHTGINISSFTVFREVEGLGGMAQLSEPLPPGGSGQVMSWLDTNVVAGRTHRYAVCAISSSHVESSLSDTVDVRPLAAMPAPPAPDAIRAQMDGNVAIVSWTDVKARVPEVLGYMLLRERDGRTDTIPLVTNFLIDTLPPGGTRTYRAVTVSMHGERSAPSVTATASYSPPPPPPPDGLQARTEERGVLLSWQPPVVGDVERYHVYRYVRGGQPAQVGAVDARQEPRYIDPAPMPGQRNFYFLRSVSSLGTESADSREAGVDR